MRFLSGFQMETLGWRDDFGGLRWVVWSLMGYNRGNEFAIFAETPVVIAFQDWDDVNNFLIEGLSCSFFS
jgi:hypothetical protein